MINILLIGATGQIGSTLVDYLKNIGNLYISTKKNLSLVESSGSIFKKLNNIQPQIIINAAAYTNVEHAPQEKELVYTVNTTGPKILAHWTEVNNALLCHYSSNYIFNGFKNTPYLEVDSADPLSVYGLSKWLGEQAIRSTTRNYLIFRVGWVYSSYQNNFVKKMLRLAEKKQEIFVVNDQLGTPTSADWIAKITSNIIKKYIWKPNYFPFGTYHLSPQGVTTWFKFAKQIFNIANKITTTNNILLKPSINPISTENFSSNIQRPRNSYLDCKKLCNTFSVKQPYWLDELEPTLATILKNPISLDKNNL